MKKTPKQICQQFAVVKQERTVWETHWQDLADYIIPRKNEITTKNEVKGRKKGVDLYDNTAMVSCELLAGALHGLLTNPNNYWFELSTGDDKLDDEDDVRQYLQDLSHKCHSILNSSNFQTEVHELYLDLCCFGTANMTMEEDEDFVVHFSAKHISEVYLVENNKGVVDEVFREYKWTARQIIEEFCKGIPEEDESKIEAVVGKDVVASYKKGDGKKFDIIHDVYKESLTEKVPLPYVSQYILRQGERELRQGGFRRNPWLTPRWTKVSNETYGRSPGMNALPEAKTNNAMVKAVIKGAQKVVDPPVQMPDDGAVRPTRLIPGGINYYRAGSNDRIETIFNDTRIDIGVELTRDRQSRIREAFFVDVLQLKDGPQMTATEVNQRTEERMRLLGPMLGRQQAEFLRPLIDRLFDIMERRGLIPEAPAILQGREVTVKYSSMIAKAQRINEGQDMLRALGACESFLAIDESAKDVIDSDAGVRKVWSVYGAPQEVLRNKQEIEDIREQRAQAQQQAIEQQLQMMQAEQIQKAGPTLLQAGAGA